MPVVINEFEVVADEQQRSPATPPPPRAQPKEPDIERTLAERRARAERVRTY